MSGKQFSTRCICHSCLGGWDSHTKTSAGCITLYVAHGQEIGSKTNQMTRDFIVIVWFSANILLIKKKNTLWNSLTQKVIEAPFIAFSPFPLGRWYKTTGMRLFYLNRFEELFFNQSSRVSAFCNINRLGCQPEKEIEELATFKENN